MMVCIILARGGSKGIKNKNLQSIGGISLLGSSIKTAIYSGVTDHVFVSSDSEAILSEAKSFGAKVIKRPAELASDTASSESGLIHAIGEIEKALKSSIKTVLFIQATSPFLTSLDVVEAVSKYQSSHFNSLFTGFLSHKFIWQENGLFLSALNHNPKKRVRRQDLPKEIAENGALYIFNRDYFLKEKTRFCGRVGCSIMSEISSIDIDTTEDLELARMIYESKKIS